MVDWSVRVEAIRLAVSILRSSSRGSSLWSIDHLRLSKTFLAAAHSVLIDAGRWGDDVRLSDMEPKFTCQRPSGRADVRPLFEQARMGTRGSLGALMQAPVIVAPDLAQ
jgi:hypothetical protein